MAPGPRAGMLQRRPQPGQKARGCHRDVADGAQRACRQMGRQVLRPGDADGQVQPVLRQVDHVVAQIDHHLHLGPAQAQARQARRQPDFTEHRGRREPHRAARRALVLACHRMHITRGVDQLGTACVHLRAQLGQRQRARGAVQQPHAPMRLQAAHAAADRRGRELQLPRGGGKAAQLDHFGEHQHFRYEQGLCTHTFTNGWQSPIVAP